MLVATSKIVMTGYKNLFVLAVELGTAIGSAYKGAASDRENLLRFMDANEWFHTDYRINDGIAWIDEESVPQISDSLTLWLSAYKKPPSDKLTLLLNHYETIYPETCRIFGKFIDARNLHGDPSAWKLLDFVLAESTTDITDYSEGFLEHLVKQAENGATRTVAKLLSEFIDTVKLNEKPLSQWKYHFNPRKNLMLNNEAYPLSDFSVMAYLVFNEDAWTRQGLIAKAVKNKYYADLWLFVALHFVCALRSGDMERIPAPALPYDGSAVLEKVADGTFPRKEAAALTEDLSIRVRLKSLKPSKTAAYNNAPDIKLFVPESLKEPLGIIIATVLAHRPEIKAGNGFVRSSDSLANIRGFFGNRFVEALGNSRFSSRRCNKSYLQGIEISATDEPGKPKGYMLAALARSHKSGIGRLADTTEIYLRDARFSGYSPKFIIRQMFERGVFGFIPAILLETYEQQAYTKLPVISQTRLIVELGLTAFQVEGLAEVVERALLKSRKVVAAVLADPSTLKENIGSMLQNIASGAATGKNQGCLCLLTAAGLGCRFPDRGGCVGCGYEIYTNTTMFTLMREYSRLTAGANASNADDAKRYTAILQQAVVPAVTEMLASAKMLYPDSDISGLLDIMEVEMNGVSNERRIK